MYNFYFTFGSDERFPYTRDQYVLVKAEDVNEACQKFRAKHPDRTEGILNCADYYTELEYNTFLKDYYSDVNPVEIIE